MPNLTIYGASDDLVEIEGLIRDEYYLPAYEARLRVTDPNGQSLDVVLTFGTDHGVPGIIGGLDWKITVEALQSYPDWPVHFHERADYEGDPAVTLDVPEGTTVHLVGDDDNE